MPVTTVEKQKGTKTCRSCGSNLSMSAKSCQNCSSTNISKVHIVIKKTEATGKDALVPDETESVETEEVEEFEDDDELEEDDFEEADDEDEEDDDEEDEDDEVEDEEEKEKSKVSKRVVRRRRIAKSAGNANLDIALAVLTVFEDISKAVASGDVDGDNSTYERGMTAFNNFCDAGAPLWAAGNVISKETPEAKLKRLKAKLAALKAKAGAADDEGDVEKSDTDIFKGMTPQAAAIVKAAQKNLEQAETKKFQSIAKSYKLPVKVDELGAALQSLSKSDPKAYETIKKSLKAAAEASKQSEIFKQFGMPGTSDVVSDPKGTLDSIAKSFLSKDDNLTQEQAFAMAIDQNPGLYDQMLASARVR